MKREYIVTILADPELATRHGILDEREPVEEQIREAIKSSLASDFLYKDMEIEVGAVQLSPVKRSRRTKVEIAADKATEQFRKDHPIKWPTRSVGNDVNWDDED